MNTSGQRQHIVYSYLITHRNWLLIWFKFVIFIFQNEKFNQKIIKTVLDLKQPATTRVTCPSDLNK